MKRRGTFALADGRGETILKRPGQCELCTRYFYVQADGGVKYEGCNTPYGYAIRLVFMTGSNLLCPSFDRKWR